MNLSKIIAATIFLAALYFVSRESKSFSNPVFPRTQQLADILSWLEENPDKWDAVPDQALEQLENAGLYDTKEPFGITEKGKEFLANIQKIRSPKKNPIMAKSPDLERNIKFLRKHPDQFETVPDDVMESLITLGYYDPDENEVTVKGLNFLNEYRKLAQSLEVEA